MALAGLFAAWTALPPRAAALNGYLAGLVFFSTDFSWFGETAGALVGPFAFVLDLGPAVAEALAFAVAAAVASLAARRLGAGPRILTGAAAFTAAEWLRSSGVLGVPLYQVGAPFAQTPLAPLASVAGVYGLTFAVTLAGAALGAALIARSRAAVLRAAAVIAAIAGVTALAWATWPARTVPVPALRVAAIQGDIKQSLKWNPASLQTAVDRYTALTAALRPLHPRFVLWPETVMTTNLAADLALQARLGALARELDATLAVGSIEASDAGEYNDLFYFDPAGRLEAHYRKRQLVPFAEFLPGPGWLRAIPGAALVSNFGIGDDPGPIDPRLRVGTLICWESAFSDVAQQEVAAGATLLAIATDDAWFGASDGPYTHAQVATLRAIETGRWVVRSAATGISGIIAPDGGWRARGSLDDIETIVGDVGEPQPTLYSRFGPHPVGIAMVLIVLAGFARGRSRA